MNESAAIARLIGMGLTQDYATRLTGQAAFDGYADTETLTVTCVSRYPNYYQITDKLA